MEMIGSYVTGIMPRPERLIQVTRLYDRGAADKDCLKEAFAEATFWAIDCQLAAGFTYLTDGMLEVQDIFRPLAERLDGIKTGGLARWFNNNTFYRKPIIVNDIERKEVVLEEATYCTHLPENLPWKAILPAPYTFMKLSENRFYKDKTELMFRYAEALRSEMRSLVDLGFKYIQLSDPALVYASTARPRDEFSSISESLRTATKGIFVQTSLQTFFGDFSHILPDVLDFPVDDLGIDLYETNLRSLKEYPFDKGVALGLIDSRNSLVEDMNQLVSVASEIIDSIYQSGVKQIFICPNCDLEFLPWNRAKMKMKAASEVADRLRKEYV